MCIWRYFFSFLNFVYMLSDFTPSGIPSDSRKSSSTGIIIGAAVGGCVLFLLLLLAGIYAFRQKKRADTAARKTDPFGNLGIIFSLTFC